MTRAVSHVTLALTIAFGMQCGRSLPGNEQLGQSLLAFCFYTSCTLRIPRRVYGQFGSLTTANSNQGGISAESLNAPWDVASDSAQTFIVDRSNHRVLRYVGTSTVASRVYGQLGSMTTGTANNGGVTADSLGNPLAVAFDSTGVYICDINNHRVLFYPGTSTTATRVYGQLGSFTTSTPNNGGISANSLSLPYGVAVDSTGVYIADRGNSRVLFYPGTSTTATRVYGQLGSFATATSNNGGISADSMQAPYRVALDSSGVYIADRDNNRVLFYPGTSTTASRVYGQSGSFTTATASNGGVSASSLHFPVGVSVDSNGVYIVEVGTNRMLYFTGSSTTASVVFGQPDFASFTANADGISGQSLSNPTGTYGGGPFVADTGNHRVLLY
ncbi:MAG: NHL repeat-containing protein [Leptospirales bacterium]|nr:NHL repeat-containing protein [Leptospirales bacterium]